MQKKEESRPITGGEILRATWKIISVGISIALLLMFAMIFFSIFGAYIPTVQRGNVAVIPIEGLIQTDDSSSFMPGAKSSDIVKLIEQAQKNDEIKALIIEVNSPGGTPVATDEIASAIKLVNKTKISVIRESGTSGAYWISTAGDRIFANRMSIVGSIGVTASRLEVPGLLADYNVTYRKLTAGRLKDAGTIYRDMTPEETQLFQNMLDKLHTEFIKAVAENRKLPEETVRSMATGFTYLGSEAKELGLIDEFGGRREALQYIETKLKIKAEPIEYKEYKTIFDKIAGMTSESFYSVGKGIGSVFATDTKISFT
ncbi:Peptidase family S49 [uncultured archaeon]|nr:Peptidase family S49 [uncultured archaeon]